MKENDKKVKAKEKLDKIFKDKRPNLDSIIHSLSHLKGDKQFYSKRELEGLLFEALLKYQDASEDVIYIELYKLII